MALRILPVAAFGAFLLIVLLGFIAKGVGKSAHRFTFVDAGAGMSQGIARRYRGFFASDSQTISVRGTARTSYITVPGGADALLENYEVDRDGPRIVDFESVPSQTVLIEELGIAPIGSGISITPGAAAPDVVVTNHTGKSLQGVIIKRLDDTLCFEAKLKDGESISTVDHCGGSPAFTAWAGGVIHASTVDTPLNGKALSDALSESKLDEIGDEWDALDRVSGGSVDWFPRGVPVVLAAVEGGEGVTSDSGVKISRDILLTRIVGFGGTK